MASMRKAKSDLLNKRTRNRRRKSSTIAWHSKMLLIMGLVRRIHSLKKLRPILMTWWCTTSSAASKTRGTLECCNSLNSSFQTQRRDRRPWKCTIESLICKSRSSIRTNSVDNAREISKKATRSVWTPTRGKPSTCLSISSWKTSTTCRASQNRVSRRSQTRRFKYPKATSNSSVSKRPIIQTLSASSLRVTTISTRDAYPLQIGSIPLLTLASLPSRSMMVNTPRRTLP